MPTFGGQVEQSLPSTAAMQMDETKRMHDISLIDEICNMIRLSCKEQEIVRLINQYQIEEARLINMEQGKQLTEEN